MASETDIANRALQKLGAKRITSLSDDTPSARAANACYAILRDAELRKHPWNFAIDRAELAADATTPDWGRANSFTLPADFLRLLKPYPEQGRNDLDHQIEGTKIYTNDAAPIQIRYIKRVTDTSQFDALFVEALAAKMADEMAEELTQSNSKKAATDTGYKDAIREAKRTNAIENVPAVPTTDEWLTVRN